MSDHIGTSKTDGTHNLPSGNVTLPPAEVDYVVRMLPLHNPLGLKALDNKRIYQVWKVLVDPQGDVLQVVELCSTTEVDLRYVVN